MLESIPANIDYKRKQYTRRKKSDKIVWLTEMDTNLGLRKAHDPGSVNKNRYYVDNFGNEVHLET